jgi:hypothetical protein
MDLYIRYNHKNHGLTVTQDADVHFLMDLIAPLLSIPIDQQQIIYHGKPLNNPSEKLANLSITNGAKLLLWHSTRITEVSPSIPHITFRFVKPFDESLLSEPHCSILSQGVPNGAVPSFNLQTKVLPLEPFHIYCTNGGKALLSIESDALFVVASDGSVTRIFFDTIYWYCIKRIHPTGLYFAIGIRTEKVTHWFYFLPLQYHEHLRKLISNRI